MYTEKRLSGLVKLKGKTYEEVFGVEKANLMKEKMRLAKLGKKRPDISKLQKERLGEKSNRWIKDRNLIKKYDRRNDPLYLRWVREVKNRDKWTCQINNKDCNGKVIAHHILSWSKYPELRYNINNGITLCQHHHPLKRVDEIKLIPVLQELVEVIRK